MVDILAAAVDSINSDMSTDIMCYYCDNKFSKVTTLKKHMEREHPYPTDTKKVNFLCDICQASFLRERNLKLHRKIEHGDICEDNKDTIEDSQVEQKNKDDSNYKVFESKVSENIETLVEDANITLDGETLSFDNIEFTMDIVEDNNIISKSIIVNESLDDTDTGEVNIVISTVGDYDKQDNNVLPDGKDDIIVFDNENGEENIYEEDSGLSEVNNISNEFIENIVEESSAEEEMFSTEIHPRDPLEQAVEYYDDGTIEVESSNFQNKIVLNTDSVVDNNIPVDSIESSSDNVTNISSKKRKPYRPNQENIVKKSKIETPLRDQSIIPRKVTTVQSNTTYTSKSGVKIQKINTNKKIDGKTSAKDIVISNIPKQLERKTSGDNVIITPKVKGLSLTPSYKQDLKFQQKSDDRTKGIVVSNKSRKLEGKSAVNNVIITPKVQVQSTVPKSKQVLSNSYVNNVIITPNIKGLSITPKFKQEPSSSSVNNINITPKVEGLYITPKSKQDASVLLKSIPKTTHIKFNPNPKQVPDVSSQSIIEQVLQTSQLSKGVKITAVPAKNPLNQLSATNNKPTVPAQITKVPAQITTKLEKKLQCATCKKIFLSKSEFGDHVTKEHKSKVVTDVKFRAKCDKCTEAFNSTGDLLIHKKLKHATKCPKCDKLFESKQQISIHMKNEHEYTCTHCGKVFDGNLILKHHLDIHHTFPCKSCNSILTSQAGLASHEKKKHRNCEVCEDEFSWAEPGHSCYYTKNNIRPSNK